MQEGKESFTIGIGVLIETDGEKGRIPDEIRTKECYRIDRADRSLILAIILVAGTMWMGTQARRDTEEAVRSVSLLYLDELAGRREQVVESNLREKIQTIRVAIELMIDEELSDKAHLEAYQTRMKQLYHLDKFAFVDTDGLIYSSTGIQSDIDEYAFDYRALSEPEISLYHPESADKRVVIAVPVSIPYQGKILSVCFMAIDMQEMLSGVSLTTNTGSATFCNIYTESGSALTDSVLGGLAMEDNLLDAMHIAAFEPPYSYESFLQEFQAGTRGVVSFTFNGIRETLTYIPVSGTDWQLTYLIRESVISERISSISEGAVRRSIVQSVLTVAAMLLMFGLIFEQTRRNSRLLLEQETAEAENRVKREELEHRLALQEKLLEEERQREQQDKMITALAADYWSVYYLELDKDAGVCYQAHTDLDSPGFKVGEHFTYLSSVTAYANQYITDQYREEFLRFIQPDSIREGLKRQRVISYTYMVKRHGKVSYETVRFARVHHAGDQDGQQIDSVGACFVDVDANTRHAMEQQQALSDALIAAEEASKAKTAFLSNMSHEIRTPMNAIIGLDSIALNDPDLPQKTREYLEKIGASAEHLLGLINDILDMSRIESGRLTLKNEEFSFQKLLEAINTMFSGQCQDKGLEYRCRINSEVDDYYIGDNMKLRQVLINILGNAVKFTPAGGRVELQVEKTAQFDGKSSLRFTVSDTGIGMSKEYLPHLYDTFSQEDSSTTTKYGSTGLGMPITKSIVELMNGHIEVESEKGVGTCFYVTVTLSDSDRTDLQGEEEVRPDEMTVLIVDDDPVACRHAQLVLEKAGIAAELADSGKQAVEMVRLRHARMDPYNLILVDWKMPEMDGLEATRTIRAMDRPDAKTIPIIALTANAFDEDVQRSLQAGLNAHLSKPVQPETLYETMESLIR